MDMHFSQQFLTEAQADRAVTRLYRLDNIPQMETGKEPVDSEADHIETQDEKLPLITGIMSRPTALEALLNL